jgi:GT2 family glycosyltransferase
MDHRLSLESTNMVSPLQVSGSIVAYNNDPAQVVSAARSFLSSQLRVSLTVVDNSPVDGLRGQIAAAGAEYSFNGRNVGFGSAHNIAIRRYCHASEYHLILNPDVRFGPEVLDALYRFMQSNPEVGLVMPRVLYPDGDEQHLCKLLPTPFDLLARRFGGSLARTLFKARMARYLLQEADLSKPREVPCLSGCCMLVRTSLFQSVGLFDERYFMYMEDYDLCRRIGDVSKTVFFPDVAIYHEYQKGSYKNRVLMKHHINSAWKYFCKWGWFVDRTRDKLNKKAVQSMEGFSPLNALGEPGTHSPL